MSFFRILAWMVAVLAAAVISLYILRPDIDAPPPPPVAAPPPPVAAPPPPRAPRVMSPADASSPAEITAKEAEEAIRRLEKKQEDETMDGTPSIPPDMMPP